jgi:hypothetical protein
MDWRCNVMSSDTENTADASSDQTNELTAFLRFGPQMSFRSVPESARKQKRGCCLPVLTKANNRTQRTADIPQMNRIVVYKRTRSQLVLEARPPRDAQNLNIVSNITTATLPPPPPPPSSSTTHSPVQSCE